MRLPATINRRETILVVLAAAVLAAVTYGVVTYQTPYACDSSGVAQGPRIDSQVLAKPCIYVYFIGIVGGSTLLILLIPVSEKKPISSATPEVESNGNILPNVRSARSGADWT